MKQSILIFSSVFLLVGFSSFAYLTFNNKTQKMASCQTTVTIDNNLGDIFREPNNLDLYYNIDSRFIATVSKEQLHQAKTVFDMLPKSATENIKTFQDVTITILDSEEKVSQIGGSAFLNPAQIKLLQSTDYGTNFHISANHRMKSAFSKASERYDFVYYATIIPEKVAIYKDGKTALIEYIKSNANAETTVIARNKLEPGKVKFTITKDGKVANVQLNSTSGYILLDQKIVNLISNLPENWIPATNSKGEKVEQELIFFFGLQGC